MSKDFHLFVLQKHSPQSYTYVGEVRHTDDDSSVTTVKPLVEIIQKDMKSRWQFKSWGDDVDGINFVVYLPPQNLQGPKMVEMVQGGQMESNTCPSSMTLSLVGNPRKFVIVFESLSYRFVLFQTIGSSHRCITVETATALHTQKVDIIKQAARDCIKVCFDSNYEADVHVWEPREPFSVDDRPTAQSKKQLDELIDKGYMDSCSEHRSDHRLEDITHREHLIITFTLRFNVFLCERGPSLSHCIGYVGVAGWSEDPIQIIKRAAEEHIKEALSIGSDPAVEFSVDQVNLYEPKGLYQKTLEQMESILNDNQLARTRGLVTLFAPGDTLKKISSPNLIVECVVTRHHKLRFKYRLFERKPESFDFEFAGRASVEASSEQTMQVILDAVRYSINSLPDHGTNTGHRIHVYTPTEAFEEAYNKSTRDLDSLKLERRHLQASPAKCAALLPQETLSNVDPGQTLIVVFDLPC